MEKKYCDRVFGRIAQPEHQDSSHITHTHTEEHKLLIIVYVCECVKVCVSHLVVHLKVAVVLRHVLQRRLLQTAAQKPRDQAYDKHADVGNEHSDAVPGVCTSDAAARQTHTVTYFHRSVRSSHPELTLLTCGALSVLIAPHSLSVYTLWEVMVYLQLSLHIKLG